MIDHIKLSSYDGASHRIDRLNQYIGALYAKERSITDKILALHDHKGDVSILWARRPTPYERALAAHVWFDGETEHFTSLEEWEDMEGTPAAHFIALGLGNGALHPEVQQRRKNEAQIIYRRDQD